jgi:peptidoglycan pentaglycine glycine transferase (the first glycine)
MLDPRARIVLAFCLREAQMFNVHLTSSVHREKWDRLVALDPTFGLLQSWAWGEFKERVGWKAFRVVVEEDGQFRAGAQMLLKPLISRLLSVAYIPRGPFGNWLDKDTAPLLLSELHRIARQHGAIFLKIEPPLLYNSASIKTVEQHGFRISPLNNQPVATLILDLDPDLDKILRQMRTRTREYIGYSARMGVVIRAGTSQDLPEFTNLMRITARREKFISQTRSYYAEEWKTFSHLNQAVLLMAYYHGQLLAVHMAYKFGEHAAYFHGGSSKDFTNYHPNYLLIWEAIKWAKAQGCRTFDLWGIPDEVGRAVANGEEAPIADRNDGLWGVYQFKRGFCKNEVCYLGSMDYIYEPLAYPVITNKYLNVSSVGAVLAWVDSHAA